MDIRVQEVRLRYKSLFIYDYEISRHKKCKQTNNINTEHSCHILHIIFIKLN